MASGNVLKPPVKHVLGKPQVNRNAADHVDLLAAETAVVVPSRSTPFAEGECQVFCLDLANVTSICKRLPATAA